MDKHAKRNIYKGIHANSNLQGYSCNFIYLRWYTPQKKNPWVFHMNIFLNIGIYMNTLPKLMFACIPSQNTIYAQIKSSYLLKL